MNESFNSFEDMFRRNLTISSPKVKKTNDDETLGRDAKAEHDLTRDRVREDLRYTLIMKQYENRLHENSQELFNNLVEKMIAKRAETMQTYWKKQSEDSERRALESKARKLQMLKELQENDNLSLLEKARIDEQKCQNVNTQTIENMNRFLEEQNEAMSRIASITISHNKICKCYNEITNLTEIEPYAKSVCNKFNPTINTVMNNVGLMMDLYKTGSVTDKEVKQAEILYANIENIKQKIIDETNQLKNQELQKKQKEEEELTKKLYEEKKAKEAKAAEAAQIEKALKEQAKATGPLFYSPKNYENYEELKKFLEHYELQYKDLLENTSMKKFRFDCQKAVNTPVNAISSVNSSHLRDKFDKLSKLLKGERVQVLDTFVCATQHPQGLSYCTALLAKKIVRQGDLLVSSNPEAAFPLATITVALWSQFPEFGKLLLAYFHRMCPYLVPMFLPQKEGQTDKEFYMSRGYTYNDEGVVEKQDKFLKRMSGIFRLHCAIWTARTPSFVNASNPHSLGQGWQWLASFINLKPEPDICATLLHDFFTVCGSEFFKHYNKQFVKIIKLITTDYLAILQNIDEGGPKTRLEVFLQDVLRTGHIPPPNGLLPSNFW